MADAARHLHAIEGELPSDAPQTLGQALERIAWLSDQLAGAENNVRSMRSQLARKNRELAGEVDTEHELFPRVVANFRLWQRLTGHEKTELTADRMKLALPFHNRHTDAEIRQAIRGAAFDPYVTQLKNGTEKRHDGWDLIFRNEDKFSDFSERAPNPGEPTFTQQARIASARDFASQIAERFEERKALIEKGEDVPVAHLLTEVNRLLVEWMEAR